MFSLLTDVEKKLSERTLELLQFRKFFCLKHILKDMLKHNNIKQDLDTSIITKRQMNDFVIK